MHCDSLSTYDVPLTRDQKVELVHSWQRHYNMQPRSDSRLTELYADGHVLMAPDQVARELLATDYIYKYTLYGETIEEFLRHVALAVKQQYSLTWTAPWDIVRFYGPIMLKIICLLTTDCRIPERMPDSSEA